MTSPFGSVVEQLLNEASGSIPYNLPEESIYLESVRGLRDELDSIVAGDEGFVIDPSTIDHDSLLNFDQDEHFLKSDITAADITMAVIDSPTFSSVQHMQDIFHSSGWVSGGVLSDDGSQNIDVTAGEGLIRATDSRTAQLLFNDWGKSLANAISDGTSKFIGVEYNAGSPQIVVKATNTWDFNTDFPLGSVVREGSILHISQAEHAIGDHANFMIQRLFEVQKFARDNNTGGLILGEDGANRYVTVSAGTIWERLNKFSISAIDTDPGGGADDFQTYKHVSGTFTLTTGVTVWPNTQYDDGTDLVTMTNNRYANLWFYLEPDGDLVMLYGTDQYVTSSLAELESPPTTLPLRVSTHAFLAARLIFQKSDSFAQEINSVFTTVFSPTLVSDHGNLAGLSDDDHTQYILVDGTRAFTGNTDFGGFNITNVGTLAGTLTTAAQTNVTSLGTLTILQVDNISINGNTISSTAGTDLLITPLGGQQIILDGAIIIDAGVVTGITSLTSSNLLASGDDSGAIGASGTAFSDLFLASGAVINFSSSNMLITHAAGVLTVSGGTFATAALTATTIAGTGNATLTSGSVRADNGQGYQIKDGASTYRWALKGNSAALEIGDDAGWTSLKIWANAVAYTWPGSDGGSGNVLSTNGSGILSWTAGGAGALGGSGTAGTIAKWSAAATLDDSIITESGVTITVATTLNATNLGGTLSTAAQANITSVGTLTSLDMAGQIDLNTNNIIAGGTAAFTTITASVGIIQGTAVSQMVLSGGSNISAGASITLYGETHATLANDMTLESGASTRILWDDSALEFTVFGQMIMDDGGLATDVAGVVISSSDPVAEDYVDGTIWCKV